MSRGRSAILMLVGGLLLAASAHGALSPKSFSVTTVVVTPDHAGPSVINRLLFSRSPQSEALSRFTAWKARPKIVLAESDRQVVEETDLGPAPVPIGLISCTAMVLTFSRLSTPTPLRC